jgi:seryl-tRNA synthetase
MNALAEAKVAKLDPTTLPDYRWYQNGQSVFSGSLKRLYDALDAMFVRLSRTCEAEEMMFPIFIPAQELAKLDYFRSFPHLATFACTLDFDEVNLATFAKGPGVVDGAVQLTRLAPVRDALTPAACYHVYLYLAGLELDGPRFFTTRCNCFRREAYYAPLRRQWSFGMREIVCVGGMDEVQNFLARYRNAVEDVQKKLGLDIAWTAATDPFFDPRGNPKWLAQKLAPVKTEMVFEGELAIGSINFHRNFFGETFGIVRDNKPAFSGCVAFGLERWIYAFLQQHGADESKWPKLDEVIR